MDQLKLSDAVAAGEAKLSAVSGGDGKLTGNGEIASSVLDCPAASWMPCMHQSADLRFSSSRATGGNAAPQGKSRPPPVTSASGIVAGR